ncbi:hypothetical protein, partial [Salmonella sp. s60732]|uniref:hypothetical protein n=1 Tax=Salmonella sp. s60732 TaxID=3160132 RepID=UPI003753F8F1
TKTLYIGNCFAFDTTMSWSSPTQKNRHSISASTQFWELLESMLHTQRGVLRIHKTGLRAPLCLPKKTTISTCFVPILKTNTTAHIAWDT